MHTLAHEVWHLHGISSEALTECNALQTTAKAAMLLGADARPRRRRRTTRSCGSTRRMPDEYQQPAAERRAGDLRPTDPALALEASWPAPPSGCPRSCRARSASRSAAPSARPPSAPSELILPSADAVVLQAEHGVGAAGELAVEHLLDRRVDGRVDALHRARQHLRAEVRLVGVDADPPDALLLRCVEHAEPAAAGDLEDDVRAVGDLVQRRCLHFAWSTQSCEYAFSSLMPGSAFFAPAW